MKFKTNLTVFLLLIGEYAAGATKTPTEAATNTSTTNTKTITPTLPASTITSTIDYMEWPSGQREVAGVEMYFREEPNLSSAPVFNVYLGDAFYMFIRYTGSYHMIKPVECKGYSGVIIDKHVTGMVLWNKCTNVDGILENFKNVNNTLLSATLYGFQFHQSPYVTIECTVRICDPNLNSNCTNSEHCNSRRRRRMLDQNPSSLGKGSFRVISRTRNIGRPIETSSIWLHTFCLMIVFVVYIQKRY